MKEVSSYMRPQLAAIALRILLDAFLHVLGYRPAQWTAEETEWRAKQKDASSIRGKIVKDSEGKLLEEGFTTGEIRALFAASLRTDSAHIMKLHLAASVLRDMNIEAVPKKAVEKAFLRDKNG
jgi:hypothetical protein